MSARSSEGPIPAANRPTLMVVDDDQDIRETLAEFLADQGFEVQTAENGAAALERLRSDASVRVVLLDLNMPVLDGYGFLEEQRRDETLSNRVTVIVVTAGSLDRVRGGDVDVLPKPLDLNRLLRAVERGMTKVRDEAPPAGEG